MRKFSSTYNSSVQKFTDVAVDVELLKLRCDEVVIVDNTMLLLEVT